MTKMIVNIKDETHEDRLRRTGLVSLEVRRMEGDLIEVFETMN